MAYLDQVSYGGTLYDVNDTKGRAMIAPQEESSTASAAHAEGTYFTYNDLLYRATADIAVGGTITPNTNCVAVTVGAETSELKSAITPSVELKSGYIRYDTGGIISSDSRKYAEMPVCEGMYIVYRYTFGAEYNFGLAFYDINDVFIPGSGHIVDSTTQTIICPQGAYICRATVGDLSDVSICGYNKPISDIKRDAFGTVKFGYDEFVITNDKYANSNNCTVLPYTGKKVMEFPVCEGLKFEYLYTITSSDPYGLFFADQDGRSITPGIQATSTSQTVTAPAGAVKCYATISDAKQIRFISAANALVSKLSELNSTIIPEVSELKSAIDYITAHTHNLFDFANITAIQGFYVDNFTVKNSSTDTRSNLRFQIATYDASNTRIATSSNLSVDDDGRVSITFTPSGNGKSVRIDHNGSTAGFYLKFLCDTTANLPYTFSCDVSGYDPTVTNGIVFNNIQFEQSAIATDYMPNPVAVDYVARESVDYLMQKDGENVITPTLTWTTGEYINNYGSVVELSGFQVSSIISLYPGQKIVVTGAGYNAVVSMIAKADNVAGSVIYTPLVISSDSNVSTYEYTATDYISVALSVVTAKYYNVIIYQNPSLSISYLSGEVKNALDGNIIPLGALTQRTYINVVNGNVADYDSANYYSTDFIPCYGIAKIITNQYYSGNYEGLAFYDIGKKFISGYPKSNNDQMGDLAELTVPEGAAYFRTSSRFQRTVIWVSQNGNTLSKIGGILANSNPFVNPIRDGGLTGIFHKIGCIGDSLASGESISNETGSDVLHDMYDYSWGQCIARLCGITAYNFSRGGQSAITWMSEWATHNTFTANPCTLYLIGLGVNDSNTNSSAYTPVGSESDIDLSVYPQVTQTFYAQYATIIQRIKQISAKSKIFVMTIPNLTDSAKLQYNDAIRYMATIFTDVYVMDLETYGNDFFKKIKSNTNLWKGSHGLAVSYKMCADWICTYIDWFIRNNFDKFINVQFIDSEFNLT